jgi:hypothetical protein
MRRLMVVVVMLAAVMQLAAYLPGSALAPLALGRLLSHEPVAAAPGSAPPTPTPTPSAGPTTEPPASPAPSPTPTHSPFFGTGPVTVTSGGFLGWAWLDRVTGVLTTSANRTGTSTTASMIKPWLVSDYLRRAAARGVTPNQTWMTLLSSAIRKSDNNAAETIYHADGDTASINRLISICGLTDSHATPTLWSKTYVSPRDAVRIGLCIADGRAAGRRWTSWVLNEMRHIDIGRFGVIEALPTSVAGTVAIKNGWLLRDEDGLWHVSCLAIGADWILAVLMRYPGPLGQRHGELVCRDVTRQLLASRPTG